MPGIKHHFVDVFGFLPNHRSFQWRFDPPTELLGSARQLPRWRELLQNAPIDGRPVPRERLFEGNQALKRRLPESVRREDVQKLLKELEDTEKLVRFQKSVKGLRLEPASIDFFDSDDIYKRRRVRAWDISTSFAKRGQVKPQSLMFAVRRPRSRTARAFSYGLQNSVFPEDVHDIHPYHMGLVPAALAINLAVASKSGVRHLLLPGVEYTRARKSAKRQNVQETLRKKASRDSRPEIREANESILQRWSTVPVREVEEHLRRTNYANFFPESLITAYYGDIPSRFPHQRVWRPILSSELEAGGNFPFYKIPTSVADPLIPFMKEVKGG